MNDNRIAHLEEKIAGLEQELETSHGMLEKANSIIMRWDKDGIIRYVNEFGSRFFGYAAGEMHGQNVMIIVPEVEQSTGRNLAALVKDLLRNPEQYKSAPSENITRDGKTVWVTWTNEAILDEQGAVQEILTIGNDITPLMEAKESLRMSEEQFRDFFELSILGKSLTTVNGEIKANAAFRRVVGYTKDELAKLTWQDITHPDCLENDQKIFKDLIEGQREPTMWEKKYIHKDGHTVTVEISASLRRNSCGDPLHFITTVNDITERKQAEQELIKQKQQLDMVLEGSRDGYWDWNIETGDLYMSPQWHKQLGHEIGDIAPNIETLRAICHPDDFPRVMETIQLHLDNKIDKSYEVEHRFKTKSGDWKWILARGKVFRDEKDNPVRMIGTATDISHRKHAEAERERLISELKNALDEVKTLRGIIPMCTYCKKIRSDEGAWDIFEAYISERTDAQFSHGICPNCLEEEMKQFDKKFGK